jgi:phosphatidylinositol glycan class S
LHEAHYLLRTTQHALDDLNEYAAHHLRLQLLDNENASQPNPSCSSNTDVALTVRLFPGDVAGVYLQPHKPVLDLYYTSNQIVNTALTSSPLATFIATNLREIFSEEQAIISHLLDMKSSAADKTLHLLPPHIAKVLAKRKTRSVTYSGVYHLTFSIFTSATSPSSWDIEDALREHIHPLLSALSSVSQFTIDTQVQLNAPPAIDGQSLKPEDLGGFINSAEWPLSPSIGGAPTINFILYVGDIAIEDSRSDWLVPQWGGVVIQPNT